jgi:hypothetical protein
MTFGFLLTVTAPRGQHLDSDKNKIDIEFPAPIGRVTLRSSPESVPFKDALELIFIGRALETLDAAKRAGEALKNTIRLAGADVHLAMDVGKEEHRTRVGPTVVSEIVKQGILVLGDVHGLQVYEEIGNPVVLSGRAELRMPRSLTSFVEALIARSGQAENVSEKRTLACDLYAESHFEASFKNRHLTLVTALEVLGERRERSGQARQLVEDFNDAIVQAAREGVNESERDELNSLLSGANDLRSESIGSAVRRLAASAAPMEGISPTRLVSKSYSARSDLVHTGMTNQNLTALLGPLTELVRYLATTDPESIARTRYRSVEEHAAEPDSTGL